MVPTENNQIKKIMVECSDRIRPIRAKLLEHSDEHITIAFPVTEYEMTLTKSSYDKNTYKCQLGTVEFTAHSKTIQ